MVEFRKFGDRCRIYSDPGSEYEPEYAPIYDERGNWHLEEVGKRNVQAEIDSHKDSCDLHVLLQLYREGDTEILNQRAAEYFDATQMPKTYAEFLQYRIDAEARWNELSAETRDKFENNLDVFLSTAGSEDWFENLGFVKKTEEVKEVVENNEEH